MPVLVTAPESDLGDAVVRGLAALGGQVRAFGGPDTPVAVFRQLGVICATGSLLDEGHLETAMEQVHTVAHLGISPLAGSEQRLVEEAATVVSAALGAGVKRLISISVPGARSAADPLRRAGAQVEELLSAVPVPTTIVRASLVDSPELRAALSRTPLDRDTRGNIVAPVRATDLAELLVWLDEQRTAALPDAEILAADGPRDVALEAYLRSVGVTPLSTVSRVVERLRPSGDDDGGLLATSLSGPWTSGPEVPSAWERSGISPTPVGD